MGNAGWEGSLFLLLGSAEGRPPRRTWVSLESGESTQGRRDQGCREQSRWGPQASGVPGGSRWETGMAGGSESPGVDAGGSGSPAEPGGSPRRFGTMLTGSCVLRPGFWEDVWGMPQEGVAVSQFLSPHREETPDLAAGGGWYFGSSGIAGACPPSHGVRVQNLIQGRVSSPGQAMLTVFWGLL